MWACIALPSILLSLNSQQTLPVAALSRSSTLPLLLAGAFSALPVSVASSFLVAVVPALAAKTATSETMTTSIPISDLRMFLLICVRHIRGRRAVGSVPSSGDQMGLEHALDLRGADAAL